MNSILQSIKKLLGIQSDYTVFDDDITIHINSVFMILNQLNVGPADGFYISGELETWDMFIDDPKILMVRSYMYLKVKLLFDPPASSSVLESINRMISELEFRLYVEKDPNIPPEETPSLDDLIWGG